METMGAQGKKWEARTIKCVTASRWREASERDGSRRMSGIEDRWNTRCMAEDEKDWVRAVLEARAHQMGMVTEDNVSALTTYRSLARVVTAIGNGRLAAADVAWSWIAEQQQAESEMVSPMLVRMSSGTGTGPIQRWEWYARNISGWDREQGATAEATVRLRLMDMVLAHLVMVEESMSWQEWAEAGRALRLSKGTVRQAWMRVKTSFAGPKGYEKYLSLVAVLIVEGEVEGGVEQNPMEGTWWGEAAEMSCSLPVSIWGPRAVIEMDTSVARGHEVLHVQSSGEEEESRTVVEVLSSGEEETERKRQRVEVEAEEEEAALCLSEYELLGATYRVVVDWMAGSQSLRKAVEKERNLIYIPLDWQEWVYSRAMRGWVQNVVIDLCSATPREVWAKVLEVTREKVGQVHSRQVQVALLAMSPDCTTFSKVDSSNVTKGHNYRLHDKGHPNRPPKDDHSPKGRKAHLADKMVRQAIELVRFMWARSLGGREEVPVYMENPVGSLCRQDYMREWECSGEVARVTIDYCAYDHWYHKPTHIWTNLKRWTPKGRTGTGRCKGVCRYGSMGDKGKWVHRFKIAQGSTQAKGGKGRKAYKNMMPYKLHRELLRLVRN